MKIDVKYFASVREALGSSGESLNLPEQVRTVADVRRWLQARGEDWANALGEQRALRMALNHQMCEPDAALSEGAEVAFFPPVTGG